MAHQFVLAYKDNRIAGAAVATIAMGAQISLWESEGYPSHGAVPPTTFANPDNTTQGALPFTNPATGKQKWLHAMSAMPAYGTNSDGGFVTLYDRLLHISGLSGIVTTPQNINAGSDATLSRHYQDLDGQLDVGNEIWLEIYTAVGVTATTVTCSYKNENGATHTTQAVTFGGTKYREQARFIQLPLAAGDRGVQAVISVTVLATTGTAGNFGLIVAHPLVSLLAGAQSPALFACPIDDQIEILSGACLALYQEIQGATIAATVPALPYCTLSMLEA